jgi:poly(hydroxyalkanoate) granule-associated protein
MPTQHQDKNTQDSLSIDWNDKEKPHRLNTTRKNMLDFRKYTQQIWLAGLGAFSRAEEEGSKLFENLVKMGEELESKTHESRPNSAKITKNNEKINDEHKEKLDKGWDLRVQQSLNKVGLATHKDIQHLEQLILQLHHKVDALAQENQQLKQQLQNKA